MIARTQFDPSEIRKAEARAARKVFMRFGALVRTVSRRSIKTRQKVSEPGNPPTNRTGKLKNRIFFSYEPDKRNVVVGPITASNRQADVLEFGGKVRGDEGYGSPAAFLQSGFGPVAVGRPNGRPTRSRKRGRKVRVTRAPITTMVQAQRASDIFFDEQLPGSEKAFKGTREVEARPFMQPAMESQLPKLQDFWRDAIK